MKRYEIVASRGLQHDLNELEDYIAIKATAQTAERYITAIVTYCESLTHTPYRGTKRSDLRPNLRIIGYKRAVTIVFRVEEPTSTVVLLGIAYRGRSIERILERDWKEMNRLNQHRVAHPLRLYRKGWGIALCATALMFSVLPANAKAQVACGLSSVTESSQLQYPPIMRAVRFQGTVVLLVKFSTEGIVTNISAVSGPNKFAGINSTFREAAISFVKGWTVNTYPGPRECPIVIDFLMGGEVPDPKILITRSDIQHVRITAQTSIPYSNYSTAS